MSFTRRPHLDQRRRMVIYSQRREETGSSQAAARRQRSSEDLFSRRSHAAYGVRVHRRLRARWYGLVPVRRRTLLAFMAAIFALVAILAWGHWAAFWWAPIALRPDVARPLQLDRPDSFGAWFGAVFLALSSGASLLVYQLRRYRSDDYHGHYRLWRIVILVAMLISVDSVTQLTHWLGATLDAVFGQRELIAGADWIRILWTIGGAAFAVRLTGELWRDRSALMLISLTWGLFAIPIATHWNLLRWEMESGVFWLPVIALAARALLFVTVVTYLRTLYREVRGWADHDRLQDRIRAVIPAHWPNLLGFVRMQGDTQGQSGMPADAENLTGQSRKARGSAGSRTRPQEQDAEELFLRKSWWNRWRKGTGEGDSTEDSGDQPARASRTESSREAEANGADERADRVSRKGTARRILAGESQHPDREKRSNDADDRSSPPEGTDRDETERATSRRRRWALRIPAWRSLATKPLATPSTASEAEGDEESPQSGAGRRWWPLRLGLKSSDRDGGEERTDREPESFDENGTVTPKRRWWPRRWAGEAPGQTREAGSDENDQSGQGDGSRGRWWPLRRKDVEEGELGEAEGHDAGEPAKRRRWFGRGQAGIVEDDAGEYQNSRDGDLSESHASSLESRVLPPAGHGGSDDRRREQGATIEASSARREPVRKPSDAERHYETSEEEEDDDTSSEDTYANLSKAERRRLRKLQKRQGKAA